MLSKTWIAPSQVLKVPAERIKRIAEREIDSEYFFKNKKPEEIEAKVKEYEEIYHRLREIAHHPTSFSGQFTRYIFFTAFKPFMKKEGSGGLKTLERYSKFFQKLHEYTHKCETNWKKFMCEWQMRVKNIYLPIFLGIFVPLIYFYAFSLRFLGDTKIHFSNLNMLDASAVFFSLLFSSILFASSPMIAHIFAIGWIDKNFLYPDLHTPARIYSISGIALMIIWFLVFLLYLLIDLQCVPPELIPYMPYDHLIVLVISVVLSLFAVYRFGQPSKTGWMLDKDC
jgi:hypothetical protein